MKFDHSLLAHTFKLVMDSHNHFFDKLYNNLLADYPALRAFFTGVDTDHVKAELARSLQFILRNLEHPDRLRSFLHSLGESLGKLGVKNIHYTWMNQAMEKTLSSFLDKEYTPEAGKQWHELMKLVSEKMIEGASAPAADAKPDENQGPLGSVTHLLMREKEAKIRSDLALEIQIPESYRSKLKEVLRAAVREAIEAELEKTIEALKEEILTEQLAELDRNGLQNFFKKAV